MCFSKLKEKNYRAAKAEVSKKGEPIWHLEPMRVYRTKTDLKIDLLTLRVVRKGLEEKKIPQIGFEREAQKVFCP